MIMDYQDPENKVFVLMLWIALGLLALWLVLTGRAFDAIRKIVESFRFLG